MRLLTDAEMDAIFGGDGDVQTLPTVTVTGTRMSNTGGYYLPGTDGFLQEEVSAGCSWCYGYYASMYSAVPLDQVPSMDRVKCLANATALPGKGFKGTYSLHVLPSRVYRSDTLSLGQTSWVHRGGQGTTGSGVAGYQHYANMPENNWENHANGWGAHAVKRYREGAGAACPAK
jgi:hypothetical protein